jgi:acetolactate synthase small subunit
MKNNSTKYLILAVIVLTAIAYFVMVQDNEQGGTKKMSDFAIENTDAINKIIITESNRNKAELELNNGEWMLNNEFKARPENVELLLKTFRTIKVQTSVSNDMKKTVVVNMASRYKKVEIFEDGKLSKTYFVGSATKDHYGTYMLLEKDGIKSSEPYVMHIPGFNGFLESRFYTNENDWKYSGVFVYKPLNIKSIKVEQGETPEESFLITQEDKKVSLSSVNGNKILEFNNSLVENYILIYEKIFFNKVAEFSPEKVDSIKAITPLYKIEVVDVKGNSKKVNFLRKKKDVIEIDEVTGEEILYDENYLLGYYPESNEILVFQFYNLGNIFAKKSYFTSN